MKEVFMLSLYGLQTSTMFPWHEAGSQRLVLAQNVVFRSAIQPFCQSGSDFIVICYKRMVTKVTKMIIGYKGVK
jgi:hypothetical protein